MSEGFEELDPLKLPQLLELKYGGVQDGLTKIGVNADGARKAFFDFQKYLYEESTVSGSLSGGSK